MSTDWIKMRCDLRTHPKVVRMASALNADKLRVVGGLHAVWSIFDAHSADGILDGYTFKAIDTELNWKGFGNAMADIGWLEDLGGAGLTAPRFDEHNGQSAKRRAMETERKRLEREAEKAATKAGQMSASNADTKRTREEKRREEEKETSTGTSTTKDGADLGSHQPTPAGSVCRALRMAGIGDTNPGHPTLMVLLEAGATEGEFLGAVAESLGKAKPFAYLLGVVEGQRKRAAETAPKLHRGSMPTASDNEAARRAATTAEAARLLGFDTTQETIDG